MTRPRLKQSWLRGQGAVLSRIKNTYGVWQGALCTAPLRMHNFCLLTVVFCMRDRIFKTPVIFLASYVMIADDLTLTARLHNIVNTLKLI